LNKFPESDSRLGSVPTDVVNLCVIVFIMQFFILNIMLAILIKSYQKVYNDVPNTIFDFSSVRKDIFYFFCRPYLQCCGSGGVGCWAFFKHEVRYYICCDFLYMDLEDDEVDDLDLAAATKEATRVANRSKQMDLVDPVEQQRRENEKEFYESFTHMCDEMVHIKGNMGQLQARVQEVVSNPNSDNPRLQRPTRMEEHAESVLAAQQQLDSVLAVHASEVLITLSKLDGRRASEGLRDDEGALLYRRSTVRARLDSPPQTPSGATATESTVQRPRRGSRAKPASPTSKTPRARRDAGGESEQSGAVPRGI